MVEVQPVAWSRSSRLLAMLRMPVGAQPVASRWPVGDAVEVASRSDAWSRCRSTRAMRCVVEVQVQQVEPVLLISAGLGYSTIVECWRCRSTGRCGCVVEVQGDAVAVAVQVKPPSVRWRWRCAQKYDFRPFDRPAGAGAGGCSSRMPRVAALVTATNFFTNFAGNRR